MNSKISWLDFSEHYIIKIWEEQNVIKDPSKEWLAQDFVPSFSWDSENKIKIRCNKPGPQLSPEQLKGPPGFSEPQRLEIDFRALFR